MPRIYESWIKLHTDILNRPQLMELPRELRCIWYDLLLCVKDAGSEDGLIDIKRASFLLRIGEASLLIAIGSLVDRSLIEKTKGGSSGYRYSIHNWRLWQAGSKTSAEKMREYRAKKAARKGSEKRGHIVTTRLDENKVVATSLCKSPSSTLSVLPKKAKPTVALRLLPPSDQPELRLVAPAKPDGTAGKRYPEAFDTLWGEYRNYGNANAAKADAFKAWIRLSPADREQCLSGLGEYLVWLIAERKKRADYPAQHLSTFINRRGWEPFVEALEARRSAAR